MDIFKTRRSTKSYKNQMIDDEIIDKIVEAGMYAPSGKNRQSPIIIVVKNKEVRDKLEKLNAKILNKPESKPFYNAPVVAIVLADKDVLTYIYDGSLTAGNIMLKAEELNIGSCWIHRAKEMFETEEGLKILESLGIKGNYEGIANIILGIPEIKNTSDNTRKENYVYYIS